MDVALLLLLLFVAACVACYFVIKWILILLIAPFFPDVEAREDSDSKGARDITIHIEITGLPSAAEKHQDQPHEPSAAGHPAAPRFRLPRPAEHDQDQPQTPSTSA